MECPPSSFPFLDLLPELRIQVYELLVVSRRAIRIVELLPNRPSLRLTTTAPQRTLQPGDPEPQQQPAITRVSRKIRDITLRMYYGQNKLLLVGSVSEAGCLYPFTRFPTLASTDYLRCIRMILCQTTLIDTCQSEQRTMERMFFAAGLHVYVSADQKTLNVHISRKRDIDIPPQGIDKDPTVNTEERNRFLVDTITKALGPPTDGLYDGIYLLKSATVLQGDHILCSDPTPNWRGIEHQRPIRLQLIE